MIIPTIPTIGITTITAITTTTVAMDRTRETEIPVAVAMPCAAP